MTPKPQTASDWRALGQKLIDFIEAACALGARMDPAHYSPKMRARDEYIASQYIGIAAAMEQRG